MALVALFAVGLAAHAQDWTGREVGAVRLQGLERVSEQQVRSKLETQAGKTYNPRAVARDIRRLSEMGYFDHVQVDGTVEGDQLVLTYVFAEKRLIDEIRIIGNRKVRTRKIRAVLSWKEGSAFVPEGFDDERNAIVELYQTKGFPRAAVDIIADEVAPGRVRVTYIVDPGRKARIRSITFDGNQALSRRKLRKIMKTRRAWWFLGGKYDEAKLEQDLENVLDEYGNVGRLEAGILDTSIEYSQSGKRMDLGIRIGEGPEYTVESLEVANNVVYDDDEVLDLLKVHAGDVHNKGQVKEDAELVEKGYQDSGYVNATVTAQTTLDREKKTTHVVHRVDEESLKYIREIKITGNTVTKDEVIRRQLMTAPDERFDGTAVEASKRGLENTEYFDAVRTTLEDVEGSDLYTNLLIDVEEGKTGNFNFGAGYSTEERFGVFGELRLNNFDIRNWPKFSGGGQQLALRANIGDVRDQYSISFTEPEIAGYPLAFGFDVFDESYQYRGGIDYTESNTGGQIRLGKILSPFVTVRTALRYSELEVTELPYIVAPQLRLQRGGSTTISNAWTVTRNTQDRYRDPSTGARHDLSFILAGLGGDNHFTKLLHDSIWYRPLDEDEKWILSFRTREGWVNEYGASDFVPISDRFFAGGTTTIRGYDTRDVGPKVLRPLFFGRLTGKKDAIGGELRLLQCLELKYKLTDKVRAYGFLDSGGVWETAGDFGYSDVKYSIGIGLGVFVPRMGPIRIDYGYALNPDDDQGHGRLHLLTGLRF